MHDCRGPVAEVLVFGPARCVGACGIHLCDGCRHAHPVKWPSQVSSAEPALAHTGVQGRADAERLAIERRWQGTVTGHPKTLVHRVVALWAAR